jgi:Xaa-Pro aminopeptidase
VNGVERLRGELGRLGAASFLVTDPVNVHYLTGFESSNAATLVRADRVLLLTDGRYLAAAGGVVGVEAVDAGRNLATFLGERLGDLAEPPVAFEADHLTYADYGSIARTGIELLPTTRVVAQIRAVKTAAELAAVRRSAAVNDDAFVCLSTQRFVGRTEAEVAWAMEQSLHRAGAEELAFPIIVASGPNAAVPHHHPNSRVIGRGETVIVDAGAKVDGFCSDCTRTFATGELPADLQAAYGLCQAAQAEALAAVRAGAAARDVDAVARGMISAAGEKVLHGLGHGVGLFIHELPVLSDFSEATLEPGNVVTVEPGVYREGSGGVRIEDLVIVTNDAPEVLTPFPKDLVRVE